MIINPTYIGKTSRLLRKSLSILCGFAFYKAATIAFNKYAYLVHLQTFDSMPLHYRRCIESLDHRYLFQIDFSDLKVTNYDAETKKFKY